MTKDPKPNRVQARPRKRQRKRKATLYEQRKLGLPADCMVVTVDLHDPNLAPEHRDRFIAMVKAEVTQLDEQIGLWYRHRGECQIEDCDCGGNSLIERAEIMSNHMPGIKNLFGEIIIDDHRNFARLVKEFGGEDAYAALTATKRAQ
jgi:hypothetical protein